MKRGGRREVRDNENFDGVEEWGQYWSIFIGLCLVRVQYVTIEMP